MKNPTMPIPELCEGLREFGFDVHPLAAQCWRKKQRRCVENWLRQQRRERRGLPRAAGHPQLYPEFLSGFFRRQSASDFMRKSA